MMSGFATYTQTRPCGHADTVTARIDDFDLEAWRASPRCLSCNYDARQLADLPQAVQDVLTRVLGGSPETEDGTCFACAAPLWRASDFTAPAAHEIDCAYVAARSWWRRAYGEVPA